MTLRKSIIGLTVLCALVFSAFSAASASAVTSYTCSSAATAKDFSDADCSSTAGTKTFGHVSWTGTTTVTGTGKETATLSGVIAGVKVKISCEGSMADGSSTNVAGGGNTGKTIISYTGCKVTEPAGIGCMIKGGAITTNELASEAVEGPLGVKFSPASGTKFVEITVEKCESPINGTFPVTGTITAAASGAFLTTTTSSTGLKFAGNPATLVSKTTVENKENLTPLTLTGGS